MKTIRYPFYPDIQGESSRLIQKAIALDKRKERIKSVKFVREISFEKGLEYDNTFVEIET
jgi:hypothetical protein